MFQERLNAKLPTLRQWIAENEVTSGTFEFAVEKVLWGDKYRSVTFFSSQFRHSIKFPSAEAYAEATRNMMDGMTSDYFVATSIILEAEEQAITVLWEPPTIETAMITHKVTQFDWGLTLEQCPDWTPPAEGKKNRAAKAKQ